MNNQYQTEDDVLKEKRLFTQRILVVLIFVAVLLTILISRMGYLQWINFAHYHALSEGNRVSLAPITPARGLILDRNQQVLAENIPVFNLVFYRHQISDFSAIKAKIAALLPNIPPKTLDRFIKKLRTSHKYKPQYLPYKLSEKEAAIFSVNSYQISGVQLEARLKRHYPHGKTAVHALGYVGKISQKDTKTMNESRYQGTETIGKLGVEKFYEDILHGYPGVQEIETNARGKVIRKLESSPATPGQNIQLTLDIELQKYIESLVGNTKAAIVVTEPQSGEILAYVSSPGYDPNLFIDGISHKNYNRLLNDRNHPLINRVINGQYPPGSTVKPFVGLHALEKNLITQEKRIFDPGYFIYKEHRYRDWKRTGHGWVNMDKSIVQSCDTYFYELGLKMGIDTIHEGLYPFGFGHKTDIDLTGESVGILPSKAWKKRTRGQSWFNGETIIATIGQGYFTATPIQLAKATSILANRGKIVQPHLLKGKAKSEQEQIPIVKSQNWNHIIQAMENVMHQPNGTAFSFGKDLPFKMAGKTGTAQVFSLNEAEYDEEAIEKNLRDHSLFIGFAPIKKPKIAISVVIENSTQKAAPVAVKIVEYFLEKQK